ncbi:MAG: VOC family protein [Stellaceae bacterium]
MQEAYDRTAEDLGNIVALEHVNTRIPDQRLSTLFHVTGLGFTRDPYIMTSTNNMWINIGRSQFHLPTGTPQVMRGRIGLVVPDLAALARRLGAVRGELDGTRFDFREGNDFIDAVSPWGNRLRCHASDAARFGRINLGVPYVAFDVPVGTADGIARFYRDILDAPAGTVEDDDGRYARVMIGINQELLFRETDHELPSFDGHHIQIYVADFAEPYWRLKEHGLIMEESDQHQYRFKDIVDPDNGNPLFIIEHEVRSMRHPLFARPLVNRNPDQTNTAYMPGRDAWTWQMANGG